MQQKEPGVFFTMVTNPLAPLDPHDNAGLVLFEIDKDALTTAETSVALFIKLKNPKLHEIVLEKLAGKIPVAQLPAKTKLKAPPMYFSDGHFIGQQARPNLLLLADAIRTSYHKFYGVELVCSKTGVLLVKDKPLWSQFRERWPGWFIQAWHKAKGVNKALNDEFGRWVANQLDEVMPSKSVARETLLQFLSRVNKEAPKAVAVALPDAD